MARALRNIYNRQVDVSTEVEPELFNETLQIFNRAAAMGVTDAVMAGCKMPSNRFLQNLKDGNAVFSAFRVHRMQNDIAAMMTDDRGQLKPFARFARDVTPYTSHQNRQWLSTEYNTAVIRAHQAADWQQFEFEKDVLPNLEWMPSTSPSPGADHRVFWGTILPVDDPFWDQHRPGDRWNCKCSLRSTDRGATPRPGGVSRDDMPHRGLENNPGKDGHLVSDRHPYFPSSCASCPFAGSKLKALFADLAGKKDCYGCRRVDKKVKIVTEKSERAKEREFYIQEMKPLLTNKVQVVGNGHPMSVGFSKYGNKHLYSDTFGRSKILQKEDLKEVNKLLETATFVKKVGLSKTRKDDIKRFYYYKVELHGKTVYMNVAEMDKECSFNKYNHKRFLYSITDKIKE